jgi:hypothetical protein
VRLAVRARGGGWELTLDGEVRHLAGPLESVVYGPGDPEAPVVVDDPRDPFVVLQVPPEQLPVPDDRDWAHFVPADGVIEAFLSELDTTDVDITTRRPVAHGPPTFPERSARRGPVPMLLAWRGSDHLAGLPGPLLLYLPLLAVGLMVPAGISEGSWGLTLFGASFLSIFCWRWRITRDGIDRFWIPFRGYMGHASWSEGREMDVSMGQVTELRLRRRGVHGSGAFTTRRALRMVAVAAEAGLIPEDARLQVDVGFGNRRLAERVRRAGVWVL